MMYLSIKYLVYHISNGFNFKINLGKFLVIYKVCIKYIQFGAHIYYHLTDTKQPPNMMTKVNDSEWNKAPKNSKFCIV